MQYYYARRNLDFSSPSSSPLESPVYGIVTPDEQLDTKVQLRNRLNSGRLSNMPSGFPFRHVMDSRGTTHISYDPYEFREELRADSRCNGHFAAYISFTTAAAESRPTRSKKDWLSWTAHLPKLDLRPYSRGPSPKVPVAHVRVDPRVLNTVYGKYIERDPRIILRALSISLELGLLVTITLEDCGNCSGLYSVIYIGTANNGHRSLLHTAGSFGDR
ncbi:hypothetical protein C8F04DRAFT_1396951 [Mycena alexandri]|uniref:Uncharacterized protein n=1 Tax=Mycena alexandri TaxID=1745969 RepID=A0AAD6SQV0_9AGAR|nr:hypothetical protein C8F04DRAFT_1396951 [Mycena alexandri]